MLRNTIINISLAAMALVLTSGCAATPGNYASQANMKPPPPPAINYAKPKPTAGSLFTEASDTDYFTDLRAKRVGDIVVVDIVETTKAKSKNDSKATRTNEWIAGIPNFAGYEGQLPGNSTNPIISANTTSKHDAKGEIKKEDTLTASIGCTVIEVLPGGNLMVRGSRKIQVGGETQYVVLQGVVRPSDVTANNTVRSTQLANVKIDYTGRGTLSDKEKPGWLARLLDHVWPF